MGRRMLYLGIVAAAAIIAVVVVVGAPGLLGFQEKPDWLVPGARLEYKCRVEYNVPIAGSVELPAHLTIRVDEVLERGARVTYIYRLEIPGLGDQTFTETDYISLYSEDSQCEHLGTTKWRGVTVKVYKCREDDTEMTIYTPDDMTPVYIHGSVSIESGGTATLTCELLNITKPSSR